MIPGTHLHAPQLNCETLRLAASCAAPASWWVTEAGSSAEYMRVTPVDAKQGLRANNASTHHRNEPYDTETFVTHNTDACSVRSASGLSDHTTLVAAYSIRAFFRNQRFWICNAN